MKGVRVKMRAAASVLVAAGLISGLAACDAVTPQWTTHSYAPSDGVNGEAGPVHVRNAFLVSDGGVRASLVVALINTASTPAPVQVQYTSQGTPKTESVTVPAGALVSVGPGQQAALTLTGVSAKPGGLLPVFISSGGKGTQLNVPVLNNTLPGYATLTPPAPSPTTTTGTGATQSASPSPLPQ
jgi:hypothetical protein